MRSSIAFALVCLSSSLVGLAGLAGPAASAQAEPAGPPDSPRRGKTFLLSLNGGAEPFPGIIGASVGVAATDSLRFQLGASSALFADTQGLVASHVLYPAAPWSGVVGLSVARTAVHDFLGGIFGGTPSPDAIVWNASLRGGVDYQAFSGFRVGASLSWAFWANPSDTLGTRVFPGLEVGWAF